MTISKSSEFFKSFIKSLFRFELSNLVGSGGNLPVMTERLFISLTG